MLNIIHNPSIKMTRKYFHLVLIGLIGMLLPSCMSKSQEKPVITVTILPVKYFADQIVGKKMDVMCMVPAGSNPESYDPSPNQLVQLSKSNIYLAVGSLGFELAWLDKLAQNQPALKIYKTSAGLNLIDTEKECKEAHSHNEIHSHLGADPHIWSSPRTARIMARNIYNAIVATDPSNRVYYLKNYNKLIKEINQTDSILTRKLRGAKNRSFLIYHPALTYFARDYELDQFSVEFNGKEPTPQHLKQLIDVAQKNHIHVVFIQKEFDSKNAQILAQESGCKIVVIDPLTYNWSKGLIDIASALSNE